VAAPAAAAPRVQVRGHTTIRLLALEHRQDALVVTGELLDRDLLTGLPFRFVNVTAAVGRDRYGRRVRTDRWGKFRLHLPSGKRGTLVVSTTFAGDGYYASHQLPPRSLDISKKSLDLGLTMARQLKVTDKFQQLTVSTRVDGRAVSVPLSLYDGRGRRLARVTTGRGGRAQVKLPTAALGKPGPVTIQARFDGDGSLNRARRRFEALLVSPVTLELQAGQEQVASDGEITLSGGITDHGGAVPGAAVGIFAMGERVETAISDADGQFTARLSAASFPAGALDLQARYAPDVTWRLEARSPPATVRVLAPRPIRPELYLVPVLLTAALLLGLVLVRKRRGIARLYRTLRNTHATEPPQTGDPSGRIETGLRLARRSLRAVISPSSVISGEVWDATDALLIPGAVLTLKPASGATIEVRVGRSGRFETPSLADGEYRVKVTRPGYVSERFTAQLPHRGSLHGVRVDMIQVRVRMLEIYHAATGGMLPREELWACWTPRELLHHLSRKRGRRSRPLELLTRMLEFCYWGTEAPREDLLQQALTLARQVPPPE